MISMEGWLFISMIVVLFFWGVVIAVRGMFGRPPKQPETPQQHNLSTEEWGRDLWRTP